MSSGALKGIGIGCLVACAVLLSVAWDRYDENAKAVDAANKMLGGGEGIMGGMMKQMTGGRQLEAGWPDATKYCLVFGVLTALGGIVCLVKGGSAVATPTRT